MIISPSSGNTPKIHCWRCLKHGHRAWGLRNVITEQGPMQDRPSFKKQTGTAIELKKRQLPTNLDGKDGGMLFGGWRHGWPGYPQCIPVCQVIIPPKKTTAVVSLNRPMYLEMHLWLTQKDERVIRKKVTGCSIACFVRLSCCEHPECANPHHTPVSRSAWKAVSRSRNLKAENRNHGIFTGRYQAGSPGFPVYGGVPIQPCNRAIGMQCFCGG